MASTISKDPGLTVKILRVANSPLYAKRRKSENLRQALVALGLNAATTLALSFSLVSSYNGGKGSGINYTRYWRRAILSASAARTFGALGGVQVLEDIFLAALLQDIAVLAIDRVQADFYRGLPPDCTHAEIVAHEMQSLGSDHAALGGWLLRHWKLPEALCCVCLPDEIANLRGPPKTAKPCNRESHRDRLSRTCAVTLILTGFSQPTPHFDGGESGSYSNRSSPFPMTKVIAGRHMLRRNSGFPP